VFVNSITTYSATPAAFFKGLGSDADSDSDADNNNDDQDDDDEVCFDTLHALRYQIAMLRIRTRLQQCPAPYWAVDCCLRAALSCDSACRVL
jgi:hypothetical protein